MRPFWWAIAILFFSSSGQTYDIGISYGLNPPVVQTTHVKTVQISAAAPLYKNLWHRLSYSHWFEAGEGLSGGLAAYGLGTRIYAAPYYAELYWGIGYLTNPDQVWLSGHWQFQNTLCGGLMASTEVRIGSCYGHVSRGPIEAVGPNRGRDFVMAEVGFAL